MPDPGLAPLLAARLASEILVDPGLIDSQRAELLRALVPATLSNPTALDTVLARLVLACSPDDAHTLERLAAIVAVDPRIDPYESLPRPLLPA